MQMKYIFHLIGRNLGFKGGVLWISAISSSATHLKSDFLTVLDSYEYALEFGVIAEKSNSGWEKGWGRRGGGEGV